MDERELLVLGLLMTQSQHGYQINDFIERNLGQVSDMKKATAYSILKRLDKQGCVVVTIEQEGNRPPRQTYSITDNGKKLFFELLRSSLIHAENVTPAGDIGLMFIDHIDRKDAKELLAIKLDRVKELIEACSAIPTHEEGIGVNLSFRHRLALLECNRKFLMETIQELESHAHS
ncbi:PadR family transcriptional regulator [Paenibacillus sp. HJL G12]|uniref:PadR family transcriptional regulator n=1 Tax=Paenibacillus dendrobii TaxID=2691084 RepID=A0A7X3IG74_9BACL|nr:PadR family transcriptional regulator [Paenibacillus dendrobii]MWV43255.1 PadR family transcriptional regulator [Paenibacillus dendrobii]